jgi:hypothetical protein
MTLCHVEHSSGDLLYLYRSIYRIADLRKAESFDPPTLGRDHQSIVRHQDKTTHIPFLMYASVGNDAMR